MTRRRRRMRSRHRAGTRVFAETRGSSPRPRDRSDRAFAACARDGDGGVREGRERASGVRREVQSRGDAFAVSSDARRRDPSCVDPRGSPWPTVNGAPPTGFATRRSAVGRRRWDDACGSVERERVNRRVPVAFRSSTTSHPRRGRGKRRASHAAAPTRPPMGAQCGRRSFISRGRLERPCFFRLGAFKTLTSKGFSGAASRGASPNASIGTTYTYELQKNTFARDRSRASHHTPTHTHVRL